jgi:probable HAF family extracellular repeat protein
MRRKASRVFLVLKSIGMICAICFASAAFAQNRYQITRIPTAQGANGAALGINNKGEVVGYSFQGEDYQAFLYSSSDGSLTDVGLGGKITQRAPSTIPAKSPATARTGTGISWHSYSHETTGLHPRYARGRLHQRSIWD